MAPAVRQAMNEAFDIYANPGGIHSGSQLGESLFESARSRVAVSLGVQEREVIFTSGATESIAIAIWGVILAAPDSRSKVLVSSIEHAAVIETARAACKISGRQLVLIPANTRDDSLFGEVDLEFIEDQLDSKTALIAVMAVNNETGIIQPIASVSNLASQIDVPFLCDATQAVGKWTDFLTIANRGIFLASGHKIYGPKGTGVLVMPPEIQRSFFSISPGGGQERGIRGGTLNVAGAVGFASAIEFANTGLASEMTRQGGLSSQLASGLIAPFGDSVQINAGISTLVVPNTLNLRFVGAEANAVLASLNTVQASRASACSAGVEEPSHVLIAMGMSQSESEESIRLSLGRFTSAEDIDVAISDLTAAVSRVREFND